MTQTAPSAGARGRRQPERVVVLGAGLAGSLAAVAAVTARGAGRPGTEGIEVVVVERDTLPDEARPRPGVPQGRQSHIFLLRGLRAVEELLPGFADELRAAGAVDFDTGDLAWLGEPGWAPTVAQFGVLSATRPLFEQVVRRRLRALPGVQVRDGVQVAGLRASTDAEGGWDVVLEDGAVVRADLVVDASGRSSRFPVWLAALGLPAVAVTEIDAHVGYATQAYRIDPDRVAAAGIVIQATPGRPRGGLALPVEGGRWLVGAVGAGDARPPREPEAFRAFLAALPDDALARLVESGEPEGEVAVHRQTANRRHHYERLTGWPDGLLVLGDAMCAFNPVYGQGVTVAACEALELRRALERGLRPGDERRLLRRFVAVASVPWAIATGEDLRYPTSSGTVPWAQGLAARWTRELGRLASHGDTDAHRTLARVYHLMAPPRVLAHPRLIWRVLRARVVGYGPPTPRPDILR